MKKNFLYARRRKICLNKYFYFLTWIPLVCPTFAEHVNVRTWPFVCPTFAEHQSTYEPEKEKKNSGKWLGYFFRLRKNKLTKNIVLNVSGLNLLKL